MADHVLILGVDRDMLTASIRCNLTGADRKCAPYENVGACQCEDEACPCREGFHDECETADTAGFDGCPGCHAVRVDRCWYEDQASEYGTEAFDAKLEVEIPVDCSGGSAEEPFDVEDARD